MSRYHVIYFVLYLLTYLWNLREEQLRMEPTLLRFPGIIPDEIKSSKRTIVTIEPYWTEYKRACYVFQNVFNTITFLLYSPRAKRENMHVKPMSLSLLTRQTI